MMRPRLEKVLTGAHRNANLLPIHLASRSVATAKNFVDFKLYGYWRSSSSWRVRIALAHHGIDYASEFVHLVRDGGHQLKPEYIEAVNAMAQVPALRFKDGSTEHVLTQSLAIIDFLDLCTNSTANPLIPRGDSAEALLRRARVLELSEVINSGIQPFQNLSTIRAVKVAASSNGQDLDGPAYAAEKIKKGLVACEALTSKVGGRFSVGEEVSLADLCLIPQLYGARRFGVDVAEFPKLVEVEAECKSLPSFQVADPGAQLDAE
eukprot:TRINITY_DN2700_c2_g1_i1.p1 TRINITY_DN2700_c2_g1~~TRINITY_DN2700_c2_g1_i1.p1  ORF type:complete len:264 (+),score=51.62 TRINITY_DN2700_c2_g1_i1:165-956(+)